MRRIPIVGLLAAMICLALPQVQVQAAAAPYPPPVCATLEVSTTTPVAGAQITVSGHNWNPNVTVRVIVATTRVLGDFTTDASGSFSGVVTIPADLTGRHLISAEGGAACPPAVVALVIRPVTGPSGGGAGGLPTTGTNVLWMVVLGALLIAVGLGLNSARRRGVKV